MKEEQKKRFKITKVIDAIKCGFGFHDMEFKQELLMTATESGGVVLGWNQCKRCAESKIVHVLQ